MDTQLAAQHESKPAPGPLRLVQALINTADRETGSDRLASPDDAAVWLTAGGLLPSGASLSAADLQTVLDVREGLRALVAGADGGPDPDTATLAPLRRVADSGRLLTTLDDDGRVLVIPAGDTLADGLLGLLLIVGQAQQDGSWQLLKACANDDCQWVFYDGSRNHRGMWCEMASCGNKLKNRQFRARRRA